MHHPGAFAPRENCTASSVKRLRRVSSIPANAAAHETFDCIILSFFARNHGSCRTPTPVMTGKTRHQGER
jgi:hypothetical protein